MKKLPPNPSNTEYPQTLSLSDLELLDIFPEGRELIPQKLKEREEKNKELKRIIKNDLRMIREETKDEFSRYFWREVIKIYVTDELSEIRKQLFRLNRFNSVIQGKVLISRLIPEDKLNQARLTSIIDVASSLRLRKSGKNYITLCPFHSEKHPSFYLYPETNRFFCFGCSASGDVIKFVELTQNISFKNAVEYLTGR
ncbi:MAG: CHC2 zinc finger domain-containing protein [bacterium]|nr:CHC2 zinc finger domain-containing protein [bacterium]